MANFQMPAIYLLVSFLIYFLTNRAAFKEIEMDTSNTIKTPGQGSTGQVKPDDLRKTGKGMPDEKVKKDLGSQEPRRFGQNPVGDVNKP